MHAHTHTYTEILLVQSSYLASTSYVLSMFSRLKMQNTVPLLVRIFRAGEKKFLKTFW